MDVIEIIFLILGLVVRLGIPLGITLLLIRWLGRLDARWREEARHEDQFLATGAPCNPGCWLVRRCLPEQIAKCPAFAHKETPCWQVFRQKNGALRESCLTCVLFKTASVTLNA
jgi:hypothetical protein